MAASRGEFSSRFGFIMAAAGSAVGLGNIWGFPTQAASNGGAAFLVVYLILAFCLAYPALMAELIVGRHAKANAVTALSTLSTSPYYRKVGWLTGMAGLITASVILSFYAIVAGWMISHFFASIADIFGLSTSWFIDFSVTRNLFFMLLFMALTILIICRGVQQGIEKWSSRLMPALLIILVLLIIYVMTLDGAVQGLKVYLLPDFSKTLETSLIISALGQSFFSMSLGVGTMLIYGSYVSKKENIVTLGRSVTLIDIGIAFMAGLLVLPAMYVAQNNGVKILNENGQLIAEDTLIFSVLPALFETMGAVGVVVSLLFFMLMSIAALTSSISMLEAPVAYTVENHNQTRSKATLMIGALILTVSSFIIFNFSTLFGLAVKVSTQYAQPLLGLMLCLFAGWLINRAKLLKEISHGYENVEAGMFWKIWPPYVRVVCPSIILILFFRQFFN